MAEAEEEKLQQKQQSQQHAELEDEAHEQEQEEDLFGGLPPPSSSLADSVAEKHVLSLEKPKSSAVSPPPALPQAPAKGALKRSVASQADDVSVPPPKDASKRVKFKMTVDASTQQVIDAMQKITSHIGNPAKFCKASKLALQLVQANSVNSETCNYFFALLQASMQSPTSCNDPAVRADYQELFSATEGILQCFTKKQQKQLESWILRAVVGNDLFTDDSFVFSKASSRIRQVIAALPEASHEDDVFEETLHSGNTESRNVESSESKEDLTSSRNFSENREVSDANDLENDPFGLDALLSKPSRKEEKAKTKKDETGLNRKPQDENTNFLNEQREAIMHCLQLAAGRYKVTWAQTVIDILVKHAFDNMSKFAAQQRNAVEKLWASIKEQQMRRKQGKSSTGRLDVTGFERLQQRYAKEKISIRHAVGGGGDRRAEQWLG